MIHQIIRGNLKQQRLAHSLTQEKLAERANISAGTISNIERGRANPTSDTIESIAKALGIPVKEFFR